MKLTYIYWPKKTNLPLFKVECSFHEPCNFTLGSLHANMWLDLTIVNVHKTTLILTHGRCFGRFIGFQ